MVGWQAAHFHNAMDVLLDFCLVPHQAADRHRFRNQVVDGHSGVKGAVGILENHLHVQVDFPHILAPVLADVFSVVQDFTIGGLLQAKDGAPQGGLAAAAFAYHAKGLSGQNLQVHVFHSVEKAPGCFEILFQVSGFNKRCSHVQNTSLFS